MKRQHPENPALVKCLKCGKEKPLTTEFWYFRNDTEKWRPICKNCIQLSRKTVEMNCINCGKKYFTTPCAIRSGRGRFCSHKCRTKEFMSNDAIKKMAKTWIKKGERLSKKTEFKKGECRGHTFPKGNIPWNYCGTKINCPQCGKIFSAQAKRIKKSINVFCSRKCASLWSYKGGPSAARLELRDSYVKHALSNNVESKDITPEMIELKRQELIMYRTLKQFKKWRKENESNHTDVHGEQLPNEKNYERGFQA